MHCTVQLRVRGARCNVGQLPGWQGAENYPGGRGPRMAQVKYTPQVAREAPPHPKRTFAVALLWGFQRRKLPGGKFEALEEVATP